LAPTAGDGTNGGSFAPVTGGTGATFEVAVAAVLPAVGETGFSAEGWLQDVKVTVATKAPKMAAIHADRM
jgi:hypothetical protein